MTPHEALAECRLADALAIQEAVVAADPRDPAARRLLIDLLAFAGRIGAAFDHIAKIESDEPAWREAARGLTLLFQAELQRLHNNIAPRTIPNPAPLHVAHRNRAIECLGRGDAAGAVKCIDEADATTPHFRGFIDGQEFEGLHDSDDRFASVLEAFREGEYTWFAWESIRKVTLAPAEVLLDQLYRAATITLKDGTAIAVHLPLVYPDSHTHDAAFALGMETDHICPDDGPTRCIGAKLLIVGDSVEVPLADCRMIEIR